MRSKEPAESEQRRKSSGTMLVEKYRPQMSRLSEEERQKLMARGLQVIYGDTPATKSAPRR